jgi:ABC-type multidrug transport system ATPase subunit
MELTATGLGKKYGKHWVFRDLSVHLESGMSMAITGPNGSGKSTLLQILGHALTPSKGVVNWSEQGKPLEDIAALRHINFCSPYMELVEELTLNELLSFHAKYKRTSLQAEEIANRIGYPDSLHKPINQFSSGMKQRVKLALCFFFEAKALLLDEPASNLDIGGLAWYKDEIAKLRTSRAILIASNLPTEYDFVEQEIRIGDFS